MARTAGPTAGLAHVLGHPHQVHLGIGQSGARGRFLIGPGSVVAYKAVNPGFVGEVKRGVLPAIAGMAGSATRPVTGNVDSEVVDGRCGFAQIDPLFVTFRKCRWSSPQPVGTGKHLLGLSIVTADTLFDHVCGLGFAGELDELTVVWDVFVVAVGATYRSSVPSFVTVHTLAVMGTLESYPPGQLGIERGLVTGRTPGGFKGLWIGRPVVMTNEAVI